MYDIMVRSVWLVLYYVVRLLRFASTEILGNYEQTIDNNVWPGILMQVITMYVLLTGPLSC